MGWAAVDQETREELKAQISVARQQLYKVKALIQNIKHEEKKSPMLRDIECAYRDMDSIDFTLQR